MPCSRPPAPVLAATAAFARVIVRSFVLLALVTAPGLVRPAPALAQTCPCSVFAPTATPQQFVNIQDNQPLELGMKFRASTSGQVTGIRFYKGSLNTGAHAGHLWTSGGALLASVTFTGESAEGWQQAMLATPVDIAANTTYIVSYSTPTYFSDDQHFFDVATDNSVLRGLANGEDGPNAVFHYGPSGSFPDQSYLASNYWVDVVFVNAADVTPPTVAALAPVDGATNAPIGTRVTATFSEPLDPATVTAAHFTLVDATMTPVSATVTWVAASRTARLTPAAPLAFSTVYTARVTTGMTDLAGNPLAADQVWSFTTGSETTQNPIVAENQLDGNPASEWDIGGAGDPSIQGFATDISVDHGDTVHFKIDTDAGDYHIDIYRIGWYGGMGARLVATVTPSATLPQSQPAPVYDAATGETDCGNWDESAHWDVPAAAVSGVYVARLVRTDTQGANHIMFVVRDDASHSDVLMSTSDGTWEAYNSYGGNSLYVGSPAGRAYKVSYNRPYVTRGGSERASFFFNADYPLIRWLESNGYNVSYTTCVDSDRRGALIQQHKIFVTVGHDEYWSGGMRTNVEAARDAGVNLAFFSGNEVFWKTRFENSIDGSDTPYRTMTCYKETHAGAKIDPLPNVWTGTWRDARFSPPADGGRPENGLTGTIFMVNGYVNQNLILTGEFKNLRLWRNTAVATLPTNGTLDCGAGTLGFEWDEDLDNGARPAGLIRLSTTTHDVPAYLQDNGSNYAPGTATHHLTLYRAPSGAKVFGAGTVQWAWGLDAVHDTYYGGPGPPVVPAMQQATMNLFADMGNVQPASPMPGMTPTPGTTDATPPVSAITLPVNGGHVASGATMTVTGTASDVGGAVGGVEVSVDGGLTWHAASGRESWTYNWTPGAVGSATVRCRGIDDSGNIESPGAQVTVSVDPRVCPCTVWDPSVTPAMFDTGTDPYELGVRFTSDVDGFVTALRFYKGAALPAGTRTGHLWDSAGNLLATATFVETASGWQEVALPFPVAITHGAVYTASYFEGTGHWAVTRPYFNTSGYDSAPLHALKDNGPGNANGVFAVGATAFPTQSYQSSNYWVDVVFATDLNDGVPPGVIARTPAPGAINVDFSTLVTAQFGEPVQPATVAFELRGPGNVLVPATVAYDPVSRIATLTPSVNLAGSTLYTATASGATDYAGNVMTPDSWTFSTGEPPCFTDRTDADFAQGAPSGTSIARSGDGEVILTPAFGSEFPGSALPVDWSSYLWKTDGSVTVAGGQLKVDGARANADTLHMVSAGHSLEFVATFGVGTGSVSEPYQHGGFGKTFNEVVPAAHSAKFTTWAGDGFYAQSEEGSVQNMTPLPISYLGHPHLYRVDWSASGVTFSIDGAVVATHTIAISVPLRPVFSDFMTAGPGNTMLTVDWARMSPYGPTGTYVSRVQASGAPVSWTSASWTADTPAGTALAMNVRGGATPAPDGSWGAWTPIPYSGASLAISAQYLQYRADLSTSDPALTPALRDVQFACASGPDLTAPFVFSHAPATGATGVGVHSAVTVTFSEAMNPATITTARLHLRANGAPPDVPATVTLSGLMATLTPASALALDTPYLVTVDGSVADPAGNPMGVPVSWTFRTTATATIFETTVADFSDGTLSSTQVAPIGDGAVTLAGFGFSDGFDQADGPALHWEPQRPSDLTGAIPTWGVTGGTYVHDLNASPGGVNSTNYHPAFLEAASSPAGDYSMTARMRITQVGPNNGSDDIGVMGFVISGVDWNDYYLVQFCQPAGSTPLGLKLKHMDPARTYQDILTNLSIAPPVTGQWYTVKVDVSGTHVDAFIDGQLQLSGTVPGLPHGRIGLLAYEGSRDEFDDVAVTTPAAHPPAGTYTSNVFDAGSRAAWGAMTWTAGIPGATTLAISARTGDSPAPDGTWSAFTPLAASGASIARASRYVQYRADLATTNAAATPELDDVQIQFAAAPQSMVAAVVPPDACVSTANACLTVPVVFTRTESTPALAISVGIQLSPELVLCDAAHPANSIRQGSWLAAYTSAFQVVDLGGGLYQVDQTILGSPCGITSGGTLFTLDVTHSGADGTGSITVANVTARDCSNADFSAGPGPVASVTIDRTPPAAVADLVAVAAGPGAQPGTRAIALGFTVPPGALAEVYRAPFGSAPLYDRTPGTGHVPAAPTTDPPAAPWVRVTGMSGPATDDPGTRDFWYYVVATKDACGNVAWSTPTTGTLDYVLGDVSDGTPAGLCVGDNHVTLADISLLGAHYGETVPTAASYVCLDVGPTTDFHATSRPRPDGVLDFEDLALFAIDWGTTVAAPPAAMRPVAVRATGANALALDVPETLPAAGGTFDVSIRFEGVGNVRAVSVDLGYDAAVVAPVSTGEGELLASQGVPHVVLSSHPGNVDVAVFGAGLTGHGTLAKVTFRVIAAGDARIGLHTMRARDAANREVVLGQALGAPAVPTLTSLSRAMPTPFRDATTFEYGLARAGDVTLAIYGVDGRRIRTLASGPREAGFYRSMWDGRDDDGRSVANGMYYARLNAAGVRQTRTIVRVR
jgi:hypothetical protein